MMIFPGQRKGEQVLEVIRKHPVVFVRVVTVFTLVFLLPLALFLLFWFKAYPLANFYQRGVIVGIFSSLYLLYALLLVCIRWLDEEFDVFILTSERLIDVTQVGFFKRSVTSTPLEQIQDTTGTISGLFATLLKYGDLKIETASGDASDFSIDSIPDPEAVAQRILDYANERRKGLSPSIAK